MERTCRVVKLGPAPDATTIEYSWIGNGVTLRDLVISSQGIELLWVLDATALIKKPSVTLANGEELSARASFGGNPRIYLNGIAVDRQLRPISGVVIFTLFMALTVFAQLGFLYLMIALFVLGPIVVLALRWLRLALLLLTAAATLVSYGIAAINQAYIPGPLSESNLVFFGLAALLFIQAVLFFASLGKKKQRPAKVSGDAILRPLGEAREIPKFLKEMYQDAALGEGFVRIQEPVATQQPDFDSVFPKRH